MGLPEFVPPMLARLGEPFDSPAHLFELKWDGFRALALREHGGVRLRSRRAHAMEARYPEAAAALESLPAGTALDGELVTLVEGRPDFEALLPREQARDPARIARMARERPVVYVAFDLLFEGFESTMDLPLHERRQRLEALLPADQEGLVLSHVTPHTGLALYAGAKEHGLEGIVAKELASTYESGRRSGAWIKCKPTQELPCIVIGYLTQQDELRSLVIAAEQDGALAYVGRVASGLTETLRARWLPDLRSRERSEPIVAVPRGPGPPPRWVEPGPYVVVRYVERTRGGGLRAPVLVRVLEE